MYFNTVLLFCIILFIFIKFSKFLLQKFSLQNKDKTSVISFSCTISTRTSQILRQLCQLKYTGNISFKISEHVFQTE